MVLQRNAGWSTGQFYGRQRVLLNEYKIRSKVSSGFHSRYTRCKNGLKGHQVVNTTQNESISVSVSEDHGLLSKEDCAQLTPLHAGNVYESSNVPRISSARALAQALNTNLEDGISTQDSVSEEDRRRMYGGNEVKQPDPPTFLDLVLEALNDFTVLTLIAAGVVSFSLELWLAVKDGRDASLTESVSILLAVSVVVLVSAVQNWQKEKQFKALQEIQSKSFVRAIRNGVETSVPSENVVVGDLLMLETGDILCADGILVRGFNIKVDESHLTGESEEVTKDACSSQALYSGSKLLSGVGFMIVTAVGSNSQSGMIADLITGENNVSGTSTSQNSFEKEETVLQRRLASYATTIGRFGLAAAVSTSLIMSAKFTLDTFIIQGQAWNADFLETYLEFFITGVTILVVAIPEGLPLAVTISLAYAVMKMLEDNNLVRHLSAAETMGTATVICTDKTGTLTQNVMAITKVWIADKMLPSPSQATNERIPAQEDRLSEDLSILDSNLKNLLTDAIALNSTAKIYMDGDGTIQKSGNKTEIALLGIIPFLGSTAKFSMDYKKAQEDTYDAFVVGQVPFTSDSKKMTSVVLMKYKDGSYKLRLYIKGAAEVVLEKCTKIVGNDLSVSPLDTNSIETILDLMHGGGLRLLSVAFKDLDIELDKKDLAMCEFSGEPQTLFTEQDIEALEDDLSVISVVGISDPLRPEVKGAIESCKRGGISVRMFTGDNPITAASIASDCGILNGNAGPNAVIESKEFIKKVTSPSGDIDGENFLQLWDEVRVLARCSPSDKYTVVESLKKFSDEIVAVTGDGTNDAPALRIANVGFSMNDGTQIAKEAADIILVDNNFASTVNAALWGRNVYSNISKFLQFQLTVNLVALITAAIGAISSAESPLTTVQMLWVNLIMDSLASLALATGSPDASLLEQKPYGKEHNFVDPKGPLPKHICGQAIYQLVVMAWLLGPAPDVLGIPRHVVGDGPSVHHTLVFNTFVMMQLFNQMNSRQIKDSGSILENIDKESLFQWVITSEYALQYLIVEYGGAMFSTVPLDGKEWSISIGFGALSLILRQLIVLLP